MTAVVAVATRRSIAIVERRSPRSATAGDVKSAIATVMQKKISARPACALEIAAGQKEQDRQAAERALQNHRTERAPTPSHFIQRRGSARQSHAARRIVRKPTVLAISR